MKAIEAYQMKKIYAIARGIGISKPGNKEDELHILVYGLTGQTSIRELSRREASTVLARLEALQGSAPPSRRGKSHPSKPGGVTSAQQKKIWALMYELQKYDKEPSQAPIGDRLCAVIKKELKVDAIARTPFVWLNGEQGGQLIEALKRYVESARRKRGYDDGLTGSGTDG